MHSPQCQDKSKCVPGAWSTVNEMVQGTKERWRKWQGDYRRISILSNGGFRSCWLARQTLQESNSHKAWPPAAVDWISLYTSDFPARRGHHPLACGPHPPSTKIWLTCSVLMLNPAPSPYSATSLPSAADVWDPQGCWAWCAAIP